MEETKEQPTLMNHAIRWGLIVAGVSITMTILLYIIDYSLMVQLKVLFSLLAIYLGITIYAGIDYRKSVGGFLAYGKAFQHGYLILILSGLIATLFAAILYNVIDPELPQKLTDASIETTREMMENFGTPEDAIDKALEETKKRSADQFSLLGQAKGFLVILIASAIMALLSALIVRKNEPVEV